MSLRDEIVDGLGEGPVSIETLAGGLGRDAAAVARVLGQMRAVGMVSIDGGMVTLDSATPTKPMRAGKPAESKAPREAEPESAADAQMRCWVYSDRALGIAVGGTVIELAPEQVAELIEFLAGVRPLLATEAA